jgi:hypothetical protein
MYQEWIDGEWNDGSMEPIERRINLTIGPMKILDTLYHRIHEYKQEINNGFIYNEKTTWI